MDLGKAIRELGDEERLRVLSIFSAAARPAGGSMEIVSVPCKCPLGKNSMSTYACVLIALGLAGSVSAQAIHLTGWIPCQGRLDLVYTGPSLRGESAGRSVQVWNTGAGGDPYRSSYH